MGEYGNRDLSNGLSFVGCLIGMYYAANYAEGDMGFAVSGALAGKLIGEWVEWIIYNGLKKWYLQENLKYTIKKY